MKIRRIHLTWIVGIIVVLLCIIIFISLGKRGKPEPTANIPTVNTEYPGDLNLLKVVRRFTDSNGDVYWVGVSKELNSSYIIENDTIISKSEIPITAGNIMKFNIEREMGVENISNTDELETQQSIEESITEEIETKTEEIETEINDGELEESLADTKIEYTKDMSIEQSEYYVNSLIQEGYVIYKKLEMPYYCDLILAKDDKAIRIIVTDNKLIESEILLSIVDGTDYVSKYIK